MAKLVFMIAEPIGSPALGIIIPGIVFAAAVLATYLLYRHFSQSSSGGE